MLNPDDNTVSKSSLNNNKKIISAQDRTGILRVLGVRDEHYTTETCLPKVVRRWLIHSQMWKFYVGGNFWIDRAKSLCRSI